MFHNNDEGDFRFFALWLRSSGLTKFQQFQVVVAFASSVFVPGSMFLLVAMVADTNRYAYPAFLGGVILLFAALGAYALRAKARIIYGMIEIGLAVALGAKCFAGIRGPLDLGILGAFMGSVYVAVRGLDNVVTTLRQWAEAQRNAAR